MSISTFLAVGGKVEEIQEITKTTNLITGETILSRPTLTILKYSVKDHFTTVKTNEHRPAWDDERYLQAALQALGYVDETN